MGMNRLIQLAFDWFDTPAAATGSTPLPDAVTQASTPPSPTPAPHTSTPPVSANHVATTQFAHPRANRRAWLLQTWVAYEFKRARRRTIGFLVDADGLVVRAPKWVTITEMESALQEKAAWILRKLHETREQQQRLLLNRVNWGDGVTLPYLGRDLQIQLDPQRLHARHAEFQAPATLKLGLSQAASPQQIRDAVQAWLMTQAKSHFTERLEHFAQRLGVTWQKLALSNAGTRWGSAKSDGTIRLNWRLIHFKPEIIDYVVAHELSHLRVMNHSPAFWDTVKTVMPDYEQQRRALRDDRLPVW